MKPLSPLPFRGLIFDVDGTLVDSNDQHALAFVEAFRIFDEAVSYESIRPLIGMGGDKLIPLALGRDVSKAEIEKLDKKKGEVFKRVFLRQVKPFPKTRSLVLRLKDIGYELGIATSASEADLKTLLDIAEVTDLFTTKTSSDDAENSKPDPDIVISALKGMKLPAKEVVMLGDTPYDIESAAGAGLEAIAFRSGGWKDGALGGARDIYDGTWDLYATLFS